MRWVSQVGMRSLLLNKMNIVELEIARIFINTLCATLSLSLAGSTSYSHSNVSGLRSVTVPQLSTPRAVLWVVFRVPGHQPSLVTFCTSEAHHSPTPSSFTF